MFSFFKGTSSSSSHPHTGSSMPNGEEEEATTTNKEEDNNSAVVAVVADASEPQRLPLSVPPPLPAAPNDEPPSSPSTRHDPEPASSATSSTTTTTTAPVVVFENNKLEEKKEDSSSSSAIIMMDEEQQATNNNSTTGETTTTTTTKSPLIASTAAAAADTNNKDITTKQPTNTILPEERTQSPTTVPANHSADSREFQKNTTTLPSASTILQEHCVFTKKNHHHHHHHGKEPPNRKERSSSSSSDDESSRSTHNKNNNTLKVSTHTLAAAAAAAAMSQEDAPAAPSSTRIILQEDEEEDEDSLLPNTKTPPHWRRRMDHHPKQPHKELVVASNDDDDDDDDDVLLDTSTTRKRHEESANNTPKVSSKLPDAPSSTATTQERDSSSSSKKTTNHSKDHPKRKEVVLTSHDDDNDVVVVDAKKRREAVVTSNDVVVAPSTLTKQQQQQQQGNKDYAQRDAFLPPVSLPAAGNMDDRATVVVKSSSNNNKEATGALPSSSSTSGSLRKKKKKKMKLPLVSKVEGPNKALRQTQPISKEQQQAAMPIPAPRYYQPPPPPSARMSSLPPNYYSHGVGGPAPPPHSSYSHHPAAMGMPRPPFHRPPGAVQSAASFLAMADNMDRSLPPTGGAGPSHNNNNGFQHPFRNEDTAWPSNNHNSSVNEPKTNQLQRHYDMSDGEIIPTENDVLCGRGRGFFEHPGNVRMLEFVKRNKLRYKKAGKAEKGSITEQVAQLIESVGGRFLKIGGKKNNTARPFWVMTTHEEKIRKISHCLREEKHYVKSTDTQGNVIVRRVGSLQSTPASPDASTEMSASTASLELGDTAKNKANARNPKPKTKMDGLTKQDRSDKSRDALLSGQAQSFVKQTTANTKPKGGVVPQKTTGTDPTRRTSTGTASYPLLAPSPPMTGIPPQATSVPGQTVIDEKLGIVMGEPKPTDILFGHDPSFYHHAGNVQLRQLIEATVGYPPLNAQNKMALARRMVAEILKQGSKFLTRQATSPARIWYQIGGSEAEMLIFRCLEEEEAKKLSLLVQDRDSSLHALRMQATGGSTPSAAGAAATAKQATALDPIAAISQQIQQQEAAEHLAHFHAQRMARATTPTLNLPHSYPPPEAAAAAPLHQPVAPFQTLNNPDQQLHQARLRIGHQQSKLSEERISQVRKAAAALGRPGLSSSRRTELSSELSPAATNASSEVGRTETNEEKSKSKEEHLDSSSSASSASSSLEDDTSDEDEDDDGGSDASPINDDSSVISDSSSNSDLTGRSPKHSVNDLGPYDVVCGRGSGTFHYAGNKRMLTMFWNVKDRYNQAKKKEKAKIGRAIIKDIKHHGGRFLKREHGGTWAEVHETTALRNVCHGIRDVSDNPEMRKKSIVADHVVASYLPSKKLLPGHLQKEKKRDRSPSQSPKSWKKAKKEHSKDVPVYVPGMTSRNRPEKYAAEYGEIIDGTPTEIDIICGRGRRFATHPGNRCMQKLVRRNAEFYVGTSRSDKALVTQFILNELFKTGGRFLKKRSDGRWETLDREGTWQKISHGIRDHLNTLQLEEERERVGAKSVGQLLRQRQKNEKDKAKEEGKAVLAALVSGKVTGNPPALPATSRNSYYASPPVARTSATTAVPHVPPSRPASGMSAEILMAAQRQAEAEAAAMGMAMGGRRPITPPTTHFHPVVHLNPPTHLNNLASFSLKRNAPAHTGVSPSMFVKRNGSPPDSGR